MENQGKGGRQLSEKFSLQGKRLSVCSGTKSEFKEFLKQTNHDIKKCDTYIDENGRVYYVYKEKDYIIQIDEDHINPFL